MIVKRLLCPERVRRVPDQFSWVDHRLVREGHIKRCGLEAIALYLLLVTVGDAEGISYYSDTAVARLLPIDEGRVPKVRRELVAADLIAYKKPLYQVLSLGRLPPVPAMFERGNRCMSIGDVLRMGTGEES